MAAYAAAVSLMHIIDLIKNHPFPPIYLDKQQLHSLTEIVNFLQEFLEVYVSPFSYSDEADPFEMRIAEAVYAAEDVIESYIVDNIHHSAGTIHENSDNDDDNDYNYYYYYYDSDNDDEDDDEVMESYRVDSIQQAAVATHHEDEQIRYFSFYEGLQKVIEAMDLIKKEAEMEMEMVKEKAGAEAGAGLFIKSNSTERIQMVGFDDVRLQLLDKLTGGDSNRQIIPIVGMGGMGKTTLAQNVFTDNLVKEHFDIRLWATISQEFNMGHTISELLSRGRGNSSVGELAEELHKLLFGRRYLIVLDDIWSIEAWDKMKFFFPDCSQRSRVIVTTRMSNLAAQLTNSSNSLSMSFLNEAHSWTLFSNVVFGSEVSVPDLEGQLRKIGEKIVRKCKGLPLSIVVIGGLLAKSERTQGYWEYIEKNLNSIVNLEDEEYCLRVLKLSYNHLPAYLKPCFLYMGVFNEDSEIKVSTIINLWVSEGLIKPRKKRQNLQKVAREYLQELVDRNLVLARDEGESRWYFFLKDRELGSVGMKKVYRMHDLVRDLSLREAQKQRFYHVYTEHDPSSRSHRRIVIPDKIEGVYGTGSMLESSPHVRSYVCHAYSVWQFPDFRLLRTLHTTYRERFLTYRGHHSRHHEYSQKDVFGLVNSRLLVIGVEGDQWLHSSISRLWSLHTLLVQSGNNLHGPVEFWNMHQLKHVEFTQGRLRLQLPRNNDDNNNNIVIMENLHTLIGMVDFLLNEDVVKRMPNLKVLDVTYEKKLVNREVHCVSYLQRLTKLESFRCFIEYDSGENLQRICFPKSLKQILVIDDYYHQIELEAVLLMIGQLPFLEELVIESGFFGRGEWETIEGQFPRLKTLELIKCGDLRKWTVSEASHFPLLEKLRLCSLIALEEIPSEIGEIATLKSIVMRHCSKSAVFSAKRIVEEQEDLYGEEELSFQVHVTGIDAAPLKSSTSPNFKVELYSS